MFSKFLVAAVAVAQASGADVKGECMGGYVKDFDVYMNCETVLGYLAIVDSSASDLSKLSKIREIKPFNNMKGPNGASLYIANNQKLTDVNGINGIKIIQGDMVIESNAALANANLDKVECGGAIEVKNNDVLQAVALGNKAGGVVIENNAQLIQAKILFGQVQGAVKIIKNPKLSDLQAVKLEQIGADAKGDGLVIDGNDKLTNLNGLNSLKGLLAGAVKISNNPALLNMDALKNVQSLGTDASGQSLTITQNAALNDVMGFSGLTGKVSGGISITGNPSLTVLAGFQKISEIGANLNGDALTVSSNAALKDFLGFEGVQNMKGALVVKNNQNLVSMTGLNNLKAVDGIDTYGNSVVLQYNSKLKQTKLTQLVKAKGGIVINNNPNLDNVVDLVAGIKAGAFGSLKVSEVKCMSPAEVKALKAAAQGAAQIEAANAVSCLKGAVTVGSGRGTICGGTSGGSWNDWTELGSTGLYMDVDTSACKFSGHPAYVSSIVGDSAHWQLTGVNSVYKATSTGFRVYVWHPVLRGKFMQFFAMKYNWKLTWLADTGKTAGRTASGATGWKSVPHTKNVIYADVPTTSSGFTATPRYISSIHGGANHWKVTGAHAIYKATKDGFRVYIVYPVALTPAFAELNQWTIAYVGSEDARTSGQSNSNWKAYETTGSKNALYINVDSSKGFYTTTPTYVTSLQGGSHHWMVTGAGAVYSATAKSFRVYLDNAQTVAFAKENKWMVNYIAHSEKVNCVMSKWSAWTACSKSCGTGTAVRVRDVITQAYYGGNCYTTKAEQSCNTNACPADCQTGAWTPYSACSVTCGAGFKTRARKQVSAAAHGGKACGMLSEVVACSAGSCPIHCTTTAWSAFSSCSKTCGTGTRTRTRKITVHPVWGGYQCPRLFEAEQCNTNSCPIDCVVSAWSPYGACSKTCGTGAHTRTRIVTRVAQFGGKACPAALTSSKDCSTGACPVHCIVSAWSQWSTCTKTCGGGTTFRKRTVTRKAATGGVVCPDLFDKKACQTMNCPVHCQLSTWSKYSTCSVSCGGGAMTRTRNIVTKAQFGGNLCGVTAEKIACNEKACPVDCLMEEFGAWSACDKTCGLGNQQRTRDVFTPARNGGKACPAAKQSRPCTVSVCPVHCWVSGWSTWSVCSQSCGVGKSTRVRNVVRQGKYGGNTCPSLKEEKECMTEKCPVDCSMSAFSEWSTCTQSCTTFGSDMKGKQSRSRTVLRASAYGGKACQFLSQSRDCGTEACPIDCAVSAWGTMSACSVTCGTGSQFQTRTITTKPQFGGVACPTLLSTSACDSGACPVHCEVSAFGTFGLCTKTCGTGEQTAYRHVVKEASEGGVQCPALFKTQQCNTQLCPIDCAVSSWAAWGICSKTCGAGIQYQYRKTIRWAKNGGKSCPTLKKTRACNPQACPIDCAASIFAKWSKCTKTCGTGAQTRKRGLITAAQHGGRACPTMSETRTCSENKCPIHCTVSKWGAYGACSKSCGSGEMTRTRTITKLPDHGGSICPTLQSSSICNTHACPVDCKLSAFSAWKAVAGSTKLRRSRSIRVVPTNGGKKCGVLVQQKEHTEVSGCKATQVYGAWSECTKKCGTGYRYRFWERISCSAQSTLKTHMQMRQGEHCNTQACANAADAATVVKVYVPPITGYQRNVKGVAPLN